MTDTKSPEQSPDFLPTPGRGEGVRRLNKLPLLVIAGFIVLFVLAVTYTFYQRQAAGQASAAESAADIGNVAAPAKAPVSPDKVVGPPTMPTDNPGQSPEPVDMFAQKSDVPTDQVVPELQTGNGQTAMQAGQAPPVVAPAPNPEREARRQQLQRVREGKLASWEAGMQAESGVQGFSRISANSGQANGGAAGGMPDELAAMAGMGQASSGGGMAGAGGRGGQGEGSEDLNQQDHKRSFLSEAPETDVYLKHTRQNPIAATEVKAGTIIPGVMMGGINSDLPGQVVGQVRQNVYDTATGQYLLIPAGARLIGTYDSTVTSGQKRVLVAWTRIVYPDGTSVSLDRMPGADRGGYAGFKDKVNAHYGRMFVNALILSGFSAGVQLSQPQSTGNGLSAREIATAEMGRQLGQLGAEVARRGLDVQPTITIRPGYRFNIMVTKDMVLPRWIGRR